MSFSVLQLHEVCQICGPRTRMDTVLFKTVINRSHFPIKHTFYVRVSFIQEWVCVDLIFLYLNIC